MGNRQRDPIIKYRSLTCCRWRAGLRAVNLFVENQALLMRSARIVPEKDGAKVIGIRIFGVRLGTLLDELGMRNGDRLETINGFDITSPDDALEAYAQSRKARRIEVRIVRKNRPITLTYRLVAG